MLILLFILMSFGLTNILVYGSIFDQIRPKYKFFHCSMCMGFWCGIVIFLLFYFFGDVEFFPNIYVSCFLYGCLSSGTSYILCSLFDDNGLKISKKE